MATAYGQEPHSEDGGSLREAHQASSKASDGLFRRRSVTLKGSFDARLRARP